MCSQEIPLHNKALQVSMLGLEYKCWSIKLFKRKSTQSTIRIPASVFGENFRTIQAASLREHVRHAADDLVVSLILPLAFGIGPALIRLMSSVGSQGEHEEYVCELQNKFVTPDLAAKLISLATDKCPAIPDTGVCKNPIRDYVGSLGYVMIFCAFMIMLEWKCLRRASVALENKISDGKPVSNPEEIARAMKKILKNGALLYVTLVAVCSSVGYNYRDSWLDDRWKFWELMIRGSITQLSVVVFHVGLLNDLSTINNISNPTNPEAVEKLLKLERRKLMFWSPGPSKNVATQTEEYCSPDP